MKQDNLNKLGYSPEQEKELIRIVNSENDSIHVSGHTESMKFQLILKRNKTDEDNIE